MFFAAQPYVTQLASDSLYSHLLLTHLLLIHLLLTHLLLTHLFLIHLLPSPWCWDYKQAASTTLGLCDGGDKTQTFVHARQVFYQLNYIPNYQLLSL